MNRWSLVHTDDTTLLYRRGIASDWTFEVTRTLPGTYPRYGRTKLVHQIRQDIWRTCRNVRGFLPLVQVSTNGDETVICAGGSLMTRSGRVDVLSSRVARVLDCENNIARWKRYARRAKG